MFLQVINFSSTTIAVFIGVVGILSILAQVTTLPPSHLKPGHSAYVILQHMFMIVHTSFVRSMIGKKKK